MKVTSLRYAMLRVTDKFENDRVEVEVVLSGKDKFDEAVLYAKVLCEEALADPEKKAQEREVQELVALLESEIGVKALRAIGTLNANCLASEIGAAL